MLCSSCKKTTPPGQFATFRDRKGRVRRRGICKPCRGKYATENFDRLQQWRKEYNAKTKTSRQKRSKQRIVAARAYVNQYKSVPCIDCSRTYPPVAMDLDHVRGAKVSTIARMVSAGYKLDLIKEELAKCEVVCSNCHRVRTATRMENLGHIRIGSDLQRTGGRKK